jgi:hypothetical protein
MCLQRSKVYRKKNSLDTTLGTPGIDISFAAVEISFKPQSPEGSQSPVDEPPGHIDRVSMGSPIY